MNELLSIVWIEFIFIIFIYIVYKYKQIRIALIIALVSRLILLFLSDYFRLPDISDANAFEKFAWIKSEGGLLNIIKNLEFGSEFFSSFLGFFYLFIPRDDLLLSLTSLVVSLLVIAQSWKLLNENCGRVFASRSVYLLAIFPSFVIYSVQPLREVWVALFMIVAIRHALIWFEGEKTKSAILAMIFFLVASFFHEGLILVLMMFSFFYLWSITFRTKYSNKHLFIFLIFWPITIAIFSAIFLGSINLAKIGGGDFSNMISVDYYMYYFESRMDGSASYPSKINPSNGYDFIWAVPLRVIYFLFSPFIIDIKDSFRLIDLYGLIDSMIYMIIFVYIIRNFKFIVMNKKSKFLFFMFLPALIAFSVGVGNYGTAIRHRAKFIVFFILILGLKNKFKFSEKIKNS